MRFCTGGGLACHLTSVLNDSFGTRLPIYAFRSVYRALPLSFSFLLSVFPFDSGEGRMARADQGSSSSTTTTTTTTPIGCPSPLDTTRCIATPPPRTAIASDHTLLHWYSLPRPTGFPAGTVAVDPSTTRAWKRYYCLLLVVRVPL